MASDHLQTISKRGVDTLFRNLAFSYPFAVRNDRFGAETPSSASKTTASDAEIAVLMSKTTVFRTFVPVITVLSIKTAIDVIHFQLASSQTPMIDDRTSKWQDSFQLKSSHVYSRNNNFEAVSGCKVAVPSFVIVRPV